MPDHCNFIRIDQQHQSNRVYTLNAIDETKEAAIYLKRQSWSSNMFLANVNNYGGLLRVLKVSTGSRIMYLQVSVTDGLVNVPTTGVIHKLR